ncbi:hypothetical protein CAEBREN_17102 [Caenorhabditis brenneri]|uniref:Uncharacterized protein n=1 Tax=Caenorhabditis brenneri TaxID=135651 RepID=G0N262_CAEBE|nr:hypothetical protein CAEBREN_17102 [Caenorhabditis brenneri]
MFTSDEVWDKIRALTMESEKHLAQGQHDALTKLLNLWGSLGALGAQARTETQAGNTDLSQLAVDMTPEQLTEFLTILGRFQGPAEAPALPKPDPETVNRYLEEISRLVKELTAEKEKNAELERLLAEKEAEVQAKAQDQTQAQAQLMDLKRTRQKVAQLIAESCARTRAFQAKAQVQAQPLVQPLAKAQDKAQPLAQPQAQSQEHTLLRMYLTQPMIQAQSKAQVKAQPQAKAQDKAQPQEHTLLKMYQARAEAQPQAQFQVEAQLQAQPQPEAQKFGRAKNAEAIQTRIQAWRQYYSQAPGQAQRQAQSQAQPQARAQTEDHKSELEAAEKQLQEYKEKAMENEIAWNREKKKMTEEKEMFKSTISTLKSTLYETTDALKKEKIQSNTRLYLLQCTNHGPELPMEPIRPTVTVRATRKEVPAPGAELRRKLELLGEQMMENRRIAEETLEKLRIN